MNIQEYNKRATEYNNKISTLRTALIDCSARIVNIDEDNNHDAKPWKADEMYKSDLMLDSLSSRLLRLSNEFSKLNEAYYSISLED